LKKIQSHIASIRFRGGQTPGAQYLSGRQVFDETFVEGRLITRFWNANGQIWPEMHYPYGRGMAINEPADTFQLSINHQNLAGGYTWQSAEVMPESHGVISLKHKQAGVKVKIHTRTDGSEFVVRWLEIANTSANAVAITSVAPFSGLLWAHRYDEHLPLAAESPFEVAYTHQYEWGREGDFWFEPVLDGRKSVDGGKKGRSGWGRPAFWARNRCNGQTFVCELAWGGNYEFELDCRLKAAGPGKLFFRMGLSGYDEALRVLDPGETVVTPPVHLALFQDNTDAIVQATHAHVRNAVLPNQLLGREMEIEANHRGYLCDRENVPDIIKDIDVAASVGAEMYVIDAGWYGNEPNRWASNVGDWTDGQWMHEGGGLKAVADHAHKRGLKFGLWVEIEAAGDASTLKKEHPEWLFRRNGEPISGGRALDLTQPEVIAFAESEIVRLIGDLDLDMYRIDHNHTLTPSGNRIYQGFVEDLTWRYYDNFNALFDRLRAQFPNVVFQNCAGGGGRLDWGTMAHFHNTELSDWMRLPRGMKILNGITMSLPPEALLRTFGTEVGEHVLDGDVDTQLRHCFCRMIIRGIAPSLEEVSLYLRERVEHYIDLYKQIIRPTTIDGLVYHHTPFQPLSEKTPWCVLEYAKADQSSSVAVVFRTSDNGAQEYCFRPRGIDPGKEYIVTLDNRELSFRVTGYEIMNTGIAIRLEPAIGSELILMQAAADAK